MRSCSRCARSWAAFQAEETARAATGRVGGRSGWNVVGMEGWRTWWPQVTPSLNPGEERRPQWRAEGWIYVIKWSLSTEWRAGGGGRPGQGLVQQGS